MIAQILKLHTTISSDEDKRGTKKTQTFLLLCFFVVFGTGCQGTFPDKEHLESSRSDYPPYTLGPEDKIRITVYGHADLSGSFTVDDVGTISLPLIGRINARGLTLPEIEQTVTEQLSSNQILHPKVSIETIELRPFCVLGEVKNPGCFSYVFGLSGSKAIATAGGYTYRSEKNKFVITRENGRKVAGDHDTPVFSGDMIEVFERFF